jgi:hypothetical protein
MVGLATIVCVCSQLSRLSNNHAGRCRFIHAGVVNRACRCCHRASWVLVMQVDVVIRANGCYMSRVSRCSDYFWTWALFSWLKSVTCSCKFVSLCYNDAIVLSFQIHQMFTV